MLLLLIGCGTDAVVGKSGVPTVEILSPVDGTLFVPGETLTLCATVRDDSALSELDMRVQSSLDGEVAIAEEADCEDGNVKATFTLGEGSHDVQLVVYDPDGNSSIDHVQLEGEEDQAPFCSISSPRDGGTVDQSTEFTLLATVDDAETALEDLVVTVESTVEGDLWAGTPNVDGTISVPLTLDTAGDDLLIVGVTDDRGQRSTCTAAVIVDDCVDLDADGVENCDGDCRDDDPSIHPGAAEAENGIDDDCNGLIDDTTRLYDDDGDGYTELDGDCDDANAAVHPDAPDAWYDGLDSNCDGEDDDQDGDGYGIDDDCADLDPSINPGASDRWYDGVDSDCDGADDYDQDGDGYEADDYGGTDCDDTDATIYPGAPETYYDGIDQDCSGDNDADLDGDGYTSEAAGGSDCDDGDPGVNPGETEVWYDGTDQDCDGNDDDQDLDGWAADVDCDDLDGTRNPGASDRWYDGVDSNCDGADDYDQDADGYDRGADCDDTDDAVHPGAAEVWYDGIDQDCSGGSDADQDGDGYTSVGSGGSDCDDLDAGINPGASEVWYDGVDQDCDGNDRDQDGDGWELGLDCADTNPLINPDATEIWYDGVDTDCDGADDYDQDGDGYEWDVDCEDTVDTVHPGAPETRDGYDNDCDDACDEGLIASGDLLITEVMKDPKVVGDSDGEWFEVYNPTAVDIRMCGWTISDGGTDHFTMTAGASVLVEAGGYAVFGRNATTSANGGVTEDYQFGSDMTLGNGADEIILTIDGVEVDRVEYTDGGAWPDPVGLSFGLDPAVLLGPVDATSNDAGADWCSQSSYIGGSTSADKGTPGVENDPC